MAVRVQKINYFGTTVYYIWHYGVTVRCPIETVRASFLPMKKIFTSKDLPVKVRMLYVSSVLLFGVEAWAVNESMLKRPLDQKYVACFFIKWHLKHLMRHSKIRFLHYISKGKLKTRRGSSSKKVAMMIATFPTTKNRCKSGLRSNRMNSLSTRVRSNKKVKTNL